MPDARVRCLAARRGGFFGWRAMLSPRHRRLPSHPHRFARGSSTPLPSVITVKPACCWPGTANSSASSCSFRDKSPRSVWVGTVATILSICTTIHRRTCPQAGPLSVMCIAMFMAPHIVRAKTKVTRSTGPGCIWSSDDSTVNLLTFMRNTSSMVNDSSLNLKK